MRPWPPQAAWVAHRRRKVAAQAMLANQIHGQLDLIFPGLTGCFAHGLDAASLRVLIGDLPDPDRAVGTDALLAVIALGKDLVLEAINHPAAVGDEFVMAAYGLICGTCDDFEELFFPAKTGAEFP